MNPAIDVDLINVYVPEASQLSLEAAMVVATQRDQDAALNLEASVLDSESPLDLLIRDLYGD